MMKVYLAAPIFNPPQLAVVDKIAEHVKAQGHELFSPYANSQMIFEGKAPKDCTPAQRGAVLEDNITFLRWCDVLLCWVGGMGGFTDPGVVWEMGYAKHAGKFQLAFLDEGLDARRGSMNLMLSGTIDAITVGFTELNAALGELAGDEARWPKFSKVRSHFHPDVHLKADMEPVV